MGDNSPGDETMETDSLNLKRTRGSVEDLIHVSAEKKPLYLKDRGINSNQDVKNQSKLTGNSVANSGHTENLRKNNDLFSSSNNGPYGVWIGKVNKDNKEVDRYTVGGILFSKYPSIVNIVRKDRFRVEVIFKSSKEANQLLVDKDLVKYNLKPFLPEHRTVRKGLARYIPTHFTESQIFESIRSTIPVIDVFRITRKNFDSKSDDDSDARVPTRNVVFTFSGQELPNDIFVLGCKTYLTPYVYSPKMCYNCYRFGHVSKSCKNKKTCVHCGKEESESCCDKKSLCCVNCKKEHKSNDKTCEVYVKNLKINCIMAYRGLSFVEAREIIDPRTIEPPVFSKENFPALKENKNVKYYSQIVAEFSTQIDEYLLKKKKTNKNKGTTSLQETETRKFNTYDDLLDSNTSQNENFSSQESLSSSSKKKEEKASGTSNINTYIKTRARKK